MRTGRNALLGDGALAVSLGWHLCTDIAYRVVGARVGVEDKSDNETV
jgi:hypothetical protein